LNPGGPQIGKVGTPGGPPAEGGGCGSGYPTSNPESPAIPTMVTGVLSPDLPWYIIPEITTFAAAIMLFFLFLKVSYFLFLPRLDRSSFMRSALDSFFSSALESFLPLGSFSLSAIF
jgi:hypothetical protein